MNPWVELVFSVLFLFRVPLGSLVLNSISEGEKMVQSNQRNVPPSAFNSQTGKTFPEGLVHGNLTRWQNVLSPSCSLSSTPSVCRLINPGGLFQPWRPGLWPPFQEMNTLKPPSKENTAFLYIQPHHGADFPQLR